MASAGLRAGLGVAVALTGVLAGCSGEDEPAATPQSPPDAVEDEASTGDGDAAATFDRIPEVVDAVAPSVVAVATDTGEGSGVIVAADGVVVTNAHVVGEASEVEVTLADATSLDAEVVATDRLTDLAVLRVDRDGLPAAELADALPEIGELALALGNPLGFENSVTAGIISGLGREFPGAAQQAPALVDLIQTDAPISPGNSGGALVDASGTVVGINVAYVPPSGGAVSIGFAIPAPTVSSAVDDLLEDGRVSHAFLGVRLQPVTPELDEQYDLGADRGALVLTVTEGGPADEEGIEAGDVVVAAGGDPVRTVEDLLGAIRRREPGDELTLSVVRGGDEREVTVRLAERPPG